MKKWCNVKTKKNISSDACCVRIALMLALHLAVFAQIFVLHLFPSYGKEREATTQRNTQPQV